MRLATLSACAALALVAGCSTNPMRPGQWEMTLTSTIDGIPQTTPVARACVTRQDIDDPIRTLPRPEGTCTLANVTREYGGKASYDIECKSGERVMKGRAQIAYAGDRYDGTATLDVVDKGVRGTPLTMRIDARRTGDCTK